MFDIGWLELMVIGIVALIVVGPKDLPGMFRTVGQFVGKARGMAREFQRSMEEAADESGLKDAASSLNDMNSKIGLNDIQTSTKNYAKNWAKESESIASDAAKATARGVQDNVTKVAEPPAKVAKKTATKAKTATKTTSKSKAASAVKPKVAKAKAAAKTQAKPATKAKPKTASKSKAAPKSAR
jgi:sec-independent protein translocase protein TatB